MGSFISNVGLYTMNLNNMKLWNICKLLDQDIMMAIFIVVWIKLISEFKQIIHILHSKWKFSHHLFHVIPNLYEFFFLWNTQLFFFGKFPYSGNLWGPVLFWTSLTFVNWTQTVESSIEINIFQQYITSSRRC